MSDIKFCKRVGKSRQKFVFDIFKKKGLGLEDGCFRNTDRCFVFNDSKNREKILVERGCYIIRLGNKKNIVLTEAEFKKEFKLVL